LCWNLTAGPVQMKSNSCYNKTLEMSVTSRFWLVNDLWRAVISCAVNGWFVLRVYTISFWFLSFLLLKVSQVSTWWVNSVVWIGWVITSWCCFTTSCSKHPHHFVWSTNSPNLFAMHWWNNSNTQRCSNSSGGKWSVHKRCCFSHIDCHFFVNLIKLT
jgi:hypothetical protein